MSPPPRTSSVDAARAEAAANAVRGMGAARMAIVISGLLGAVKFTAGVLGHSYALIADGIESLVDIVASIAVWGGLKVAAADPSQRFPYGYGKAEPLVGLVISAGLVCVAGVLAVQSIHEIRAPHLGPEPFTLLVLVAVVAVKELLFRWLVKTGKEIGSSAMQSDAWHHRSDALTSLAAFVGITIALWGGKGYEAADDWAALAACGLIAFNGVRLFRDALGEILDAAPPAETLQKIRDVAAGVAGVTGIDDCRARKSGLGWLVDIHVEVDGEMPVREGHRIAHEVKDALLASDAAVLDALVHIEPSGFVAPGSARG
ncbi:cation diffusion facilitator family transporter [Lacipirellula sp.]|uniref:cation diffusion facilitator family transporter n=1 Tax=Lacipirellula sp. TaxID=2691419 RepID=UPI003D100D67